MTSAGRCTDAWNAESTSPSRLVVIRTTRCSASIPCLRQDSTSNMVGGGLEVADDSWHVLTHTQRIRPGGIIINARPSPFQATDSRDANDPEFGGAGAPQSTAFARHRSADVSY